MKSCTLIFLRLLALLMSLVAMHGAQAAFTINNDGTVFDPKTGLTWMRCSMGQTWDGSTCTGTANTYTFNQTIGLTTTFAGTSDWRVPNIRELQTIVDRTVYNPAIDSVAFPNTPTSPNCWSSSPYANDSITAWYVTFYNGSDGNYYRSDSNAVRLVRGGQSFGPLLSITRPTSDYVDNGNGTVTHTPTNLTWKRCSEGQTWTGSTCTGTASTYTFDQANALTGTVTFAGQSDWRLPTEDALLSLVDYSVRDPAINSSIFPATPNQSFWSDSSDAFDSANPWNIYFGYGLAYTTGRSNPMQVRLVRGGESFGPFVLTISISGAGYGNVASSPSGISCYVPQPGINYLVAPDCTENYTNGASVTLTATPATGSTFSGWSGACTGTGSCTVSMTAAQSVTATFTAPFSTSTLQPNADGTVTDPKTGLTWMRCAMGQTWTGSTCTGTASTYIFDQATALTTTFAGQSDWRLPNIRELQTIVNRSVYNPAVDTVAFPNTPNSVFWSGSPNAGSSDYALYVSFGNGAAYNGNRRNGFAVRLVRGGQSFGSLLGINRPTSDYVDNGNGTVTHTPTNLTWKRCAEGQTWTGSTCSGTASIYTFDQANALTGATFANQSDWRVPTVDEMVSLVDYSIAYPGPTINSSVFLATPGYQAIFWSGSPHAVFLSSAWVVGFGLGEAVYSNRSDGYAVRLVRSAGSPSSAPVCTLSANPPTINAGSNSTLTATCSPAASSYAWTGGVCSSTSATCTVTPTTTTTYTVTGASSSGTGAAASATVTVNTCSATLSSNSTVVGAVSSSVSVAVSSTCAWTAASNASWITIPWSGGEWAGSGTFSLRYTVAANTSTSARTGTMTIAGQTYTVTQAGVTAITSTPVCTLSANHATINTGSSSILTATCNPSATSYVWTGGTCAGTTGSTCTVTPSSATSYTVTGVNTVGTGNTASATVSIVSNVSSTVPGTQGNDFFLPSGNNAYYGGAGNDTYIISPSTLSGAVTAKIIDTDGTNVIQLVAGMTIASSSFFNNAVQLMLSNGAIVQVLGASGFIYQLGANASAAETASNLSFAQFAATLGASVPTGTSAVSGAANFVVTKQ